MNRNEMRKQPPKWQPDAVPSEKGWLHPETGELLVSLKGITYNKEEKRKAGRPKGSLDKTKRKPKVKSKKKVAKKVKSK